MLRKFRGLLLPALLLGTLVSAQLSAQGTAAPAPAATEAAPTIVQPQPPQPPAATAPAPVVAPAKPSPYMGERTLGPADAKVTVIEYASLTCPACANFQATTAPAFKKKWVESGKVRFIYRDFVRNQLDVVAAAMIRCAPVERHFAFYDMLFKNQSQWMTNDREKVESALLRYARLAGLPEDQVRACWSDAALGERVMKDRLDAQKEFDIKATPTIVINGKSYEGALSTDEIDRLLEAATR